MRGSLAEVLFASGFNCSQAVFGAHAEALGLPAETAYRLAAGFGAGMGRKQEVCGAVTGGLMALSLRFGHAAADDRDGKEGVHQRARTFQDRFVAVHGTTSCRDLLGVDLVTSEGQNLMKEKDLLNQVCRRCVATADRLVTEMIADNLKEKS